METNYRYKEIPLTNIILIDIIPKILSNGKVMKSMDIYETAKKYHCENGGLEYAGKSEKNHLIKLISGSLNVLKKKGLADSPHTGHWRIGKDIDVVEEKISEKKIENSLSVFSQIIEEENTPQATFGQGAYSVYMYYYPTYLELALLKKEKFWAHKIGKTEGNPLDRIKKQVGTALPERAIIPTVLKTNNPDELEKVIHHILTIRGRKKMDAQGEEWFLTCPDEITFIYDFVVNGII